MKPKTTPLFLVVLICTCLMPVGGEFDFDLRTLSSCRAMTQLTRLDVLSQVRPERKRVTLLDLCDSTLIPEDWKKAMSEVDIGESPAAGAEKVINPLQLKAFIGTFLNAQGLDPASVEIVLPESISVRRSSMLVSKEQVESIFREFILSSAPWDSGELVIRSVHYSGIVELPTGEMTYEVTAGPRERFIGNVSVTIQFLVDGEKERTLRATGKVELYRNVVHTTRFLRRNDIISEADVELQKISVTDTADRFSVSTDQVVGKRVLREIGARQPIVMANLDSPAALKRGAAVTIIHELGGLKLTAKGQTREDGSIGSTIRVVNTMTNRIINCRVIDAMTVQVVP
jgi:flagella basal body P-ring formation protein FlgA